MHNGITRGGVMKKNIQHGVSAFLLCASLTLMSACTDTQDSTKSASIHVSENTKNTKLKAGSATVAFEERQVTYSSAYIIDGEEVTINGGTYQSAITNQNVFLVVNGGKLTIKNATITKNKDTNKSDADTSLGLNASIVVVGNESSATLSNCIIETNASDSDAVYVTNEASLIIEKSEILTTKQNANGLNATYSASIEASDLTVTTNKNNSIPILNDNSKIQVSNSTLKTKGEDSPCVYTKGETTLKSVRGNANNSQAIEIVENKLILKKCNFNSGSNCGILITQDDNNKNEVTLSAYKSVIQNSSEGGLFQIESTKATIDIEDCTLKNQTSTLISANTNSEVTFNSETQNLSGDIFADKKSSISVNLKNSIINGSSEGNVVISQK